MKVAILGAGAGGAAAAVELSLAGHGVTLWNRSPDAIAAFREKGVSYEGVLGEGTVHPALVTNDLERAIADADAAVVVLPTLSHTAVAKSLAESNWGSSRPVILNPGHTGGALAFRHAFMAPQKPPIAEFSTLTYVARKYENHKVTITGRAKRVRGAAFPGAEIALRIAQELFPGVENAHSVLACDLSNVNMVLHPPGAILAAAWVEARRGDFTFYVDAMTPGVTRVMRLLDEERRKVAMAFGFDLPNVIEEMKAIGTVPNEAPADDYAAAISSGAANRYIKGPDSLRHRYYLEDFSYGLTPFLTFADIAGVEAPIAQALSRLGETACCLALGEGRSAAAMGIDGLKRDSLVAALASNH